MELYKLIRTKGEHSYIDSDGNKIVIPKGIEGYVVDKYGDVCIVELITEGDKLPITYDFYEDEIELVK